MKVGVILDKIQDSNIFIVDVGWGQLRYFPSNKLFKKGNIILYNDWPFFDREEKDDDIYYETRESWLKDENSTKTSYDSNSIDAICRFEDCEYLGNLGFEYHKMGLSKYNIVITRKKFFVYWKAYSNYIRYVDAKDFDIASNSLLFSHYAEPKHPFPNEKEWLKVYAYAKKKVEELDIPQMIDELKVEYHKNCWTRRGSDNVLFSNYHFEYGYKYHYSYLHDYYLDTIFPEYYEPLYSSEDHDCTYIHPKYKKWEVIRTSEGYNEIIEETFNGLSIEDFCTQKTNELRQVALKNYESYNKDEHILYIASHHLGWNQIISENTTFKNMEGLFDIIWGFNHQELLEQITKDNYQELIKCNNSNHPVPQLPDKYKG